MVDEVTVAGRRLALAIPLTYMNLSGEAVAPLVRRHGIDDPHHLVIVHDELDLPVGTLQGEGRRRAGRQQRPQVGEGPPPHGRLRPGPHRHRQAAGQGPGRRSRAEEARQGATGPSSTSSCRRRPTPWSSSSPDGPAAAMNRYNTRPPDPAVYAVVVATSTASDRTSDAEWSERASERRADGEATSRRTTWSLMSGGEQERNRPRSSRWTLRVRRVAHDTSSASAPGPSADGAHGRRSQDARGRARCRRAGAGAGVVPMPSASAITEPGDISSGDWNASWDAGDAWPPTASASWPVPAADPALAARCGIDIGVIVDGAGSIADAGQATSYRNAVKDLVDGFAGTSSKLGVFTSPTDASDTDAGTYPWHQMAQLDGAPGPANVASLKATVDSIPIVSGFSTNWEESLSAPLTAPVAACAEARPGARPHGRPADGACRRQRLRRDHQQRRRRRRHRVRNLLKADGRRVLGWAWVRTCAWRGSRSCRVRRPSTARTSPRPTTSPRRSPT